MRVVEPRRAVHVHVAVARAGAEPQRAAHEACARLVAVRALSAEGAAPLRSEAPHTGPPGSAVEGADASAFLPLAAIATIAIGVFVMAVAEDARQSKRTTASIVPTAELLAQQERG